MSLEMAHKVIVPQKKIRSRSFLNSGTLIVKKETFEGLTQHTYTPVRLVFKAILQNCRIGQCRIKILKYIN